MNANSRLKPRVIVAAVALAATSVAFSAEPKYAAPDLDADRASQDLVSIDAKVAPDYPTSSYRAGSEPKLPLMKLDPMLEQRFALDRDEWGSGGVLKGGGGSYDDYPAGIEATTRIRITTAGHANAGTDGTFRWYIGDSYRTLGGARNPSTTYTWTYSDSSWWQALHPDQWDRIRLEARTRDGLKIAHIQIVHNGYTILDTEVDAWLDKDYGFQMVFDHEVAMTKWALLDTTRNPVLYAAVMDIGKSGALKYAGTDVAWCSEFASYAIRTGTGLSAPTGSIGVNSMKSFFAGLGRLFDRDDVEDGTYSLKPGDYVSINQKGHSTIFVEWIDYLETFRVIDGNWGNRVRIREVDWDDVGDQDGIGSIYGLVY